MILSKTPLRMSFVGGGSDMASFYRDEPGAVVSTSIDKYIYIAVNRKFDDKIRISYSQTEEVDRPDQVRHPLVREALLQMKIASGLEISSLADIPSRGSGLGSSSSYTVGLLHALSAYQSQYAAKADLAERACTIEIEKCGEPIGKQDQYAAAFGGLNMIQFHPDESVQVDPVMCSIALRHEFERHIIVFFTGRTRSASAILMKQSDALKTSDRKILMRRMVALAFDLKRELEHGTLANVGAILNENWQLKSQLSEGISDAEIDSWYRIGRANGATGGKLLGAGNGGFLMFFAPPDRHDGLAAALHPLNVMPTRFDQNGSQIVFYQKSE